MLTEMRRECPGRAAWLASSRTPNSGRWILYSGGVANRFRMEDQLFVDALRRRCLLDLSPLEKEIAQRICNCTGRGAVGHITHLLDCPRNQYFYQARHNTMCHLLRDFIRNVCEGAKIQLEMELIPEDLQRGIDQPREPRNPRGAPIPPEEDLGEPSESTAAEESKENGPGEAPTQEERDGESSDAEGSDADERERQERAAAARRGYQRPLRADLLVQTDNALYTIDVSFVSPACRSCLRDRTDRYAGRAAKKREEKKRTKYGGLPGLGPGGAYGFTPFVVEATGRLGAAARTFIEDIAGKENSYHLSNFYNAMSAMTALYNSLMLKGARRKLHSLEDLGGLF